MRHKQNETNILFIITFLRHDVSVFIRFIDLELRRCLAIKIIQVVIFFGGFACALALAGRRFHILRIIPVSSGSLGLFAGALRSALSLGLGGSCGGSRGRIVRSGDSGLGFPPNLVVVLAVGWSVESS